MNHCNRLVPAFYRLSSRTPLVPARNIFSRRALAPWSLMERQMEEVDRQFARMERDMNAAFRELGFPFPRVRTFFEAPSATPSLTNRLFPTIEAKTSAAEAGKPGKYLVKIDVGEGASPENIKINLKDRLLTIEAKLEQISQDGNSRIYQEVSRTFTLPEGINPEEVKSLITPEGILTIEAPLPEVEPPQPKEIPISIEMNK